MRLLHLVHWIQSAHFVCFRHKSCSLKIPYILNRWDIQDNKLNKEYKSKVLVFCYTTSFTIPLYVRIEIITKSFTRPTVIIKTFYVDYNLWWRYLLQWQINSTHNNFININSKKLKSLILTLRNWNRNTILIQHKGHNRVVVGKLPPLLFFLTSAA